MANNEKPRKQKRGGKDPAGAFLWVRDSAANSHEWHQDEKNLRAQKRQIQGYADKAGLLIVTSTMSVITDRANLRQSLRSLPLLLRRMESIDVLLISSSAFEGLDDEDRAFLEIGLLLQSIELIVCD